MAETISPSKSRVSTATGSPLGEEDTYVTSAHVYYSVFESFEDNAA